MKKKKKTKKKKFLVQIWNGLLPNCIAKRKGFYIAIQSLYCRKKVLQEMGEKVVEIVLQYNFGIVTEAVRL